MGKPVYLGELRTDEAGRLIVLGGRGVSASLRRHQGHHLRQQRRLARRRLRRPGHREGDRRRPEAAGRSGLGRRRAAELRAAAEVGAHHVGPDARPRDQRQQLPRRRDPPSSATSARCSSACRGLQWVNAGFAAPSAGSAPNNLRRPTGSSGSPSRATDASCAGRSRISSASSIATLFAGALAVALRRRDEHPAAADAASIHVADQHAARRS